MIHQLSDVDNLSDLTHFIRSKADVSPELPSPSDADVNEGEIAYEVEDENGDAQTVYFDVDTRQRVNK